MCRDDRYAGHFGSYLLGAEDRALLLRVVAAMRKATPAHVACCCKVRLLDDLEATIDLVKQLAAAGADVVSLSSPFFATLSLSTAHARARNTKD